MIVNNITLEIFEFVLRKIVLIVLRVICAAGAAGNLSLRGAYGGMGTLLLITEIALQTKETHVLRFIESI